MRSLAAAFIMVPALGLAAQPAGSPGGLVGYLDADGNVALVQPADGSVLRLTTDAAPGVEYGPVAWAADGQKLAFVGYRRDSAGKVAATVSTVLRDGSGRREIYASETAAPFYLCWAPGSDRVGLLEPAPGGIAFKIVPWRGGPAAVVGTGQPYYWDWMSDGRSLVTHTGASAIENPQGARIDVLEDEGSGLRPRAAGPRPGFFQAPDASPDGRTFVAAVLAPADQKQFVRQGADPPQRLALVTVAGQVERYLAELDGVAAFAWSPDGASIALVDGAPTPLGGIVGPLAVVDPARPGVAEPTGLQVAAFSWSPDGRRLLALVPRLVQAPEPTLVFGVFVVDAATRSSELAAVIRPTDEVVTRIVPFYDQYLRSSTAWSPDSTHVALNAIGEDGAPGVYLLPVAERGPLRLLVRGTLPFWSPR